MFDAFAVWLSHRRERAQFDLMRANDLDELARDLGINRNELRYLINATPDPLQLPEMLKALGIDENALRRAQPALLRDMERICAQCVVLGRCHHAVARGVAASDYEQFCPNAATLTALRAEERPPSASS